MTALSLSVVLRNLGWTAMLVGLCMSEFGGLVALGQIAAIAGLMALGGSVAAYYIYWENGE